MLQTKKMIVSTTKTLLKEITVMTKRRYASRIEHATTATIVNNRFTTKYTFDILLEKQTA